MRGMLGSTQVLHDVEEVETLDEHLEHSEKQFIPADLELYLVDEAPDLAVSELVVFAKAGDQGPRDVWLVGLVRPLQLLHDLDRKDHEQP